MTAKHYIATLSVFALASGSVAWSSWRLLDVADEVAGARANLSSARPAAPSVEQRVEAPTTTEAAIEPVEAPPDEPAAAHAPPLIDVVAPIEGRVERAAAVPVRVHDSLVFQRALRPGDRVKKGEHLATVWSLDLGERKSRFLAATSQLMFEEASLARLREKHASKAAIAEAERQCRVDRQRMDRARRVLVELGLNDQQLDAVRQAAGKVHRGEPDYSDAETWGEIELVAPCDAMVAQVHAAPGMVVPSGKVLFRIVPAGNSDVASPTDQETEQLADSLER